MATSMKWILTTQEQEQCVAALTQHLPALRATVGISQGELAYLVGVCRQTYAYAEIGRRKMTWPLYLSLMFFFDYNKSTHQMIRDLGLFPSKLVRRFNNEQPFDASTSAMLKDRTQTEEIARMLQNLDERGLRAVKAVLQEEHKRCGE